MKGVQIAARNLISEEHTPWGNYNSKIKKINKSNQKKNDDLHLLLGIGFGPSEL